MRKYFRIERNFRKFVSCEIIENNYMMEEVKKEVEEPKRLNFLEEIIEADLKSG